MKAYHDRLTWLVQSVANNQEAFTTGKVLKCDIQQPRPSTKMYWGSLGSEVHYTVKFHNYPAIKFQDRFTDGDDTYIIIGGPWFGDNEIIVDCGMIRRQGING